MSEFEAAVALAESCVVGDDFDVEKTSGTAVAKAPAQFERLLVVVAVCATAPPSIIVTLLVIVVSGIMVECVNAY